MAKYKFPQFDLEIEPTEIIVDHDSTVAKPSNSTFNITVILIAGNARYGHRFEDLPFIGQLTISEESEVAYNALIEFEATE